MGVFTSPQQMRVALSDQIQDPAFLDRMVAEYFKAHKPAALPKESPVTGFVGYRPMSYKEPAKPKDKRDLEDYIEMMERGSQWLFTAIEDMRKGRTPKTSDELIWGQNTGVEAYNGTGRCGEVGEGFTYQPPLSPRRGPCFKCGAASGCKHLGDA